MGRAKWEIEREEEKEREGGKEEGRDRKGVRE